MMCDETLKRELEQMKLEADQIVWEQPQHAVAIGRQIIRRAEDADCLEYVALGHMVCGDALKFVPDLQQAWAEFETAGTIYLRAGSAFGWARTRIGRLAICVDLGQHALALADIARARQEFLAADDPDRNRRLHQNAGIAYRQLGELDKALEMYQTALDFAAQAQMRIDPSGEILGNLGVVQAEMGNLIEAQHTFNRALTLLKAQKRRSGITTVLNNLANIDLKAGYYGAAIRKVNEVLDLAGDDLPDEAQHAQRSLAECLLALSRYREAINLCKAVASSFEKSHARNQHHRTLRHLAVAYLGLARQTRLSKPIQMADYLRLAQSALDGSERYFKAQGLIAGLGDILLLRAKVSLAQHNPLLAIEYGAEAEKIFRIANYHEQRIWASLSIVEAVLERETIDDAAILETRSRLCTSLKFARREHATPIRALVHLKMGKLYERLDRPERALRYYVAAAGLIRRLQEELTFSMKAAFLDDNDQASRAVVYTQLQLGNGIRAFEALEALKGLALARHLNHPERQRWNLDDPETRALYDRFNALRIRYFAVDTLSDKSEANTPLPLEDQLRAVKDQLYLRVEMGQPPDLPTLDLGALKASLQEQQRIVEYFCDRGHIWVFMLTADSFQIADLGAIYAEVIELLSNLHSNICHARGYLSHDPIARRLNEAGHRYLRRLHQLLIAPILPVPSTEAPCTRLYFVPFQALHNLPFNLLWDGQSYLFQHYEIAIWPTAALALRPAPIAPSGALAMYYAEHDDIPKARLEARFVHKLYKGELYLDAEATSTCLKRETRCQILHLAVHAKHSVDRPEFSSLALADGQVMVDDLLQRSMAYELVTLSACETGLSQAHGGDEPIGLGLGFLYAGAGAILTTLWPVDDGTTYDLMKRFYCFLRQGESKAAALRHAQLQYLERNRGMHPAFWGGFQLVGNADPLSSGSAT